MKHYYSIANFAVGHLANIYNYFFGTYSEYTNDHLLGQFVGYSQGNSSLNNLEQLMTGGKPANFPFDWNVGTIQKIAKEFYVCYVDLKEHSSNWNGDDAATSIIKDTSAFEFIRDWSTTTTITAGVLDTIDYYTNSNFLSWSNPIGFPNIIVKNINLYYESFTVKSVALGVALGAAAGVVEGAGVVGVVKEAGIVGVAAAGVEFTLKIMSDIMKILNQFSLQIVELVEKYGIDSIKPLQEAGVKFSELSTPQIEGLVEKHGIDSIKPLQEAGAKFSDLYSFQIVELVEKHGIDSIKPLQEAGVKFSELSTPQIEGLVEKYGIDSIKPLQEAGVKFSDLYSFQIVELVEKHGIDSIKPLQEAGVKFSELYTHQIEGLVEKHGIEIKEKLLHPENIQDEIISDDLDIESLTDISIEKTEENSASIDDYTNYSTAMEIQSASTTMYDNFKN